MRVVAVTGVQTCALPILVLVVVGDVDVAEEGARVQIERQLGGDWGRRRAPLPPRPSEAEPSAPRFALARDDVREVHYALAFPVPGILAPETPALDVLAVVLGQGEGSRLNLGLKIERALASDVYAYASPPRARGLFVAGATLSAEKAREALAALLRELRRLQLAPLSADEL